MSENVPDDRPRTPVTSSQLKSIGYDPESRELDVEFQDGGLYRYADVPPETHRGLMDATSVGQYFHARIKARGHECTTVVPAPKSGPRRKGSRCKLPR